ncbi:S-adenosylmethionine-dependent methyltransferase [Novosphingobium marinum]|uniref:Ubiquinone/menaquinone biosynthesis C-methylase UbiE n=1 Tax=Novosphingobium marinum TaxID=1514948 RepID=A0A7Y9XT80_9SPHN|nr:class I SAM-dependent methyltransferase [Novosphingobium marinum]NYH94090.1 ubiquinone/menaquinone biosynthesis C-methylase UbiE [Novosphingobium marinum]GGC19503.1 S-adenosylmethionine-dependent methyltransferase [Novosphingobium marinum]
MGFGSWWDDKVVPRCIRFACGAKPIMELRSQLVPSAAGRVLELGCGGGINLELYDTSRVTAFAGIDPSEKGIEYAREAAAKRGMNSDIRQGFGEELPFADDTFDTVVSTFTLCSVSDHARTIGELRRVLKPGGTFLFAEHGRSPDRNVARWQDRIEPAWKRVFGGCHLSRPISPAIADSGFDSEPAGSGYLLPGPRFATWVEWGRAVKPA